MRIANSDAIEKGFIALLLQSCLWENQDENIIQMSGGLRYYEGATGHRWTDGWMDGYFGLLCITKQA